MGQACSKRIAEAVVHWSRMYGWIWSYIFFAWKWPWKTLFFTAFYLDLLSRQRWWINVVRRLVAFGTPKNFRLVRTVPLDGRRQYLFCIHPHGVQSAGAFHSLATDRARFRELFPNINYVHSKKTSLISYFPVYRETLGMTTEGQGQSALVGSKKEDLIYLLRHTNASIGVVPGGASEACFADPRNDVEYSYLKDRLGFIRLAIEAGVDIVPVYQFGLTKLYYTWRECRGLRARISRLLGIPFTYFWGSFGSQPISREYPVVTVVGRPFPTSQYSISQARQAHTEYCRQLQALYEAHKHKYGMGDKKMVFIGDDFVDDGYLPRVWKRISQHTR